MGLSIFNLPFGCDIWIANWISRSTKYSAKNDEYI